MVAESFTSSSCLSTRARSSLSLVRLELLDILQRSVGVRARLRKAVAALVVSADGSPSVLFPWPAGGIDL